MRVIIGLFDPVGVQEVMFTYVNMSFSLSRKTIAVILEKG